MKYEYKALVTDVLDGDTISVDIDLGFKVILKDQDVRLFGIDTPEIKDKANPLGQEAKDFLSKLILGQEITLETIKNKKNEDKKEK